MKRFRFRLETVLRLREQVEQQRKRELGEVLAVRQQHVDEKARLEGQLADHKAQIRALADGAPGKKLDMNALIDHRQYATAVDFQIRRTRQAIGVIEEEVARRREALAEAARERKGIEKLRERQLQAYREAEQRQQQKELDEIGLVGHSRARQAALSPVEGE